jgi:membrane protein YqaA with SNARE-associated domain
MAKDLSHWLIGLVASPMGIVLLAAADSTPFVSMPGVIDAALVLFAARRHALSWIVALLAVAASVGGAALTFWMGRTIGEHGLDRYIRPKRLARLRRTVRTASVINLAALDLIPPPFPFTPVILAAGALGVHPTTFLGTLALCRVFRFGSEAALAVMYGRRIVGFLESEVFHDLVIVFSVLTLAFTALSLGQLVRSMPGRRRGTAG